MLPRNRFALDTSKVHLEAKVLLPPRTWRNELQFPARFAKTISAARELGLNRIIPPRRAVSGGPAPVGFITTGMGRPYLEHILADIGLLGIFPILNLGLSYPVDADLVREFSGLCRHMIVVEERRSFLEKNIRDALFQAFGAEARRSGRPPLWQEIPGAEWQNARRHSRLARPQPLGAGAGVDPAIARSRRTSTGDAQRQTVVGAGPPAPPFHAQTGNSPGGSAARHRPHADLLPRLPAPRFVGDAAGNPPQFRRPAVHAPPPRHGPGGPGLPRRHRLLHHAHVRPHRTTDAQLQRHGPGRGTGSGIDPFITNKQIVFMGDGTFFHSGQAAISNAIKNGQDLTFIILENGTTAMTGHQEHPGTELDLLGNHTWLQDIEAICRAMAGTSPLTVVKLSPADRTRYKSILEKTILSDGVKIVIADKQCGITHGRELQLKERKIIKKKGYLPRKTHMNVTPEVCENCLECTRQTACPGLTNIDTDYGPKIDTDLTWCVNDGACERVRTSNEAGISVKPCPSFEQVTIVRKRRKRYLLPHMDLDKLPEPTAVHGLMPRRRRLARAHERRGRNGHRHRHQHPGAGRPQGGIPRRLPGQKRPGHPQWRRLRPDHVRQGIARHRRRRLPHHRGHPVRQGRPPPGHRHPRSRRALDPREAFRVADKERTCSRPQPAQAADGLRPHRDAGFRSPTSCTRTSSSRCEPSIPSPAICRNCAKNAWVPSNSPTS